MNTLICPSCNAMCDPDSRRCLRCNTVCNDFTNGVLNFERREPQWFSFRVIDNLGHNRMLNIYGITNYDNKTRQLTFTVQKPPQQDGIFLTTVENINALEN